MVWPTVTELPRNLEPATPDSFVQDLNEPFITPALAPAQRPAPSGVTDGEAGLA